MVVTNMHGGKRKGAGRKTGFAAREAEEARKIFATKLSAEIEPIADVLIEKAKAGDVRAAKELFDRAWGRPPQDIVLETAEEPLFSLEEKRASDKAISSYLGLNTVEV